MFDPRSFTIGVLIGMVFMAIGAVSISSASKSPEITTISLEQKIISIQQEENKCTVSLFDFPISGTPRWVTSSFDLISCEGLRVGNKVTVMMRITD